VSKWKELLKSLDIDSDASKKQDISKLEIWYLQNISKQYAYDATATVDRKFIVLKNEIRRFLETVYDIPVDKSGDSFDHLENMNAIQYASKKGYDIYLSKIFSADKSAINAPTKGLLTPLHLAAFYGHHFATNVLLESGAKSNLKSRLQQSPAHLALSFPPSVHTKDNPDLRERKKAIFNDLLKHDQNNVFAVDNSDNSLALVAAENGFSSILEEMHEHYPELLQRSNSSTHTPLHASILSHQIDCIDILTKDKELLSIPDKNARLPVHYAAMHSESVVLGKVAKKIVIDSTDIHLKTPLILAAEQGRFDNVKLLIEKGASVKLKDQYGKDAFHYAVMSLNLELITWLLSNAPGVDINQQDDYGRTGLMALLMDAKIITDDVNELMNYLIGAGYNQELVDKNGQSLQDYLERFSPDDLQSESHVH